MNDLARTIKIFKKNPQFEIQDVLANFSGRAGLELYLPEVRYDALTEFYGLSKNDFREKVAVLANPTALQEEIAPYLINWVTSVDVRAANARKLGDVEPFFQLAAIGVTVTRDNQIVLGVRGGAITPERVQQYASGLYGCAPGGSVTFKPEYKVDPITDTMANEFREELGNFEIKDSKVIGVFEAYRPGPTGIKFVGEIRTDATFKQIQDYNSRANKWEEKLKSDGALRQEIDNTLATMGLPTDAWEHSSLIGILNNRKAIKRILKEESSRFSGIGAGALTIYLLKNFSQ